VQLAAETVFWVCVGVIAYTYIGYPVLLWLLSSIFGRLPRRDEAYAPRLSVLIVAHNEAERIERKIRNVLDSDYPAERLEVIVCSDGSTDRTNEIVSNYPDERVRLVAIPENVGVNEAFAKGAEVASGEVLLLTDSGGLFDKGAIRRAVSWLADPDVGLVNGRIEHAVSDGSVLAGGYRGYWSIETKVKYWESLLGIAVVVVGAFEVIRRELYFPIPSDLSNDMTVPMAVMAAGRRVVFDPEAVMISPERPQVAKEFSKRVRIAVRAFTSLGFIRRHAPISATPVGWWALISHKYLRWLTWMFMGGLTLSNLFLLPKHFYALALAIQGIFYLTAAAGGILGRFCRLPFLLSGPYYFCMLQAASCVGFFRALRGHRIATWKPT